MAFPRRRGSLRCPVLTAFRLQRKRRRCGDQIITPSTDSTGEATDAVTEPTEAPTEAETTTTTAGARYIRRGLCQRHHHAHPQRPGNRLRRHRRAENG